MTEEVKEGWNKLKLGGVVKINKNLLRLEQSIIRSFLLLWVMD